MAGQHLPGLSWVDMGEEHPSHSAVVHCSQALWATGGYHQLQIAVGVLEEEGSLLRSQAVSGTSGYHQLRIALEVLEEEGSLHHSQAVWGTGRYHPLRIVGEELEEEGSLQGQVENGEGMLYPRWLKECLEG